LICVRSECISGSIYIIHSYTQISERLGSQASGIDTSDIFVDGRLASLAAKRPRPDLFVVTVPVHKSTYSHFGPYYAAIMPVLSDTSRRRAIFTTEILISSLSILGFSKLKEMI
jgi:hypothetical protein